VIGIRPESPEDIDFLDPLLEAAFSQPDEARIARRLRATPDLILSLVAESHGRLVGHIMFSRAAAASESTSAQLACLAPMAVHPSRQRLGLGAALIRRGLEIVRELKFPAVIVVGPPAYYSRFGFSAQAAAGLKCPYSGPCLQALDLSPGFLASLGPARLTLAPPLMPPPDPQ
jgi:putative acetyltransferase